MIKELFLPEKIRHRRIRSVRQLGISIYDDTVYGVLVYSTPSKNILEKVVSASVIKEGSEKESLAKAIVDCVKACKRFDYICVVLPSSLAIFKELEVPFVHPDKIAMILEYEVESMLPFPLSHGVIDFIITKEEKKGAHVLATAVRKQDLLATLDIYKEGNIVPDKMTIDFFALYGLYQQIPEYQTLTGGSALVELGNDSTRLAYLQDGQLRAMRHIQQGISDIARLLSNELTIPVEECLKNLLALNMTNLGSSSFERAAEKQFMKLFNDIQFSLNSFNLKMNYEQGVQKILFIGAGAQINNMISFCNHFLQIPCEFFEIQKLEQRSIVVNKSGKNIKELGDYIFALGAALPSETTERFNICRQDFSKDYSSLITRQIIAGILLLILIFGGIAAHGYMEFMELSQARKQLEDREIRRLKKIIPSNKLPTEKNSKKMTLQNLVKLAEQEVQQRSDFWIPFTENYVPPLEIIAELTKLIDKKLFDVRVKEISISLEKDIFVIELEGHFKSLTGKDNYAYFSQFKKRFSESALLELDGDFDERPQEEQGIPFTVKLKPRLL